MYLDSEWPSGCITAALDRLEALLTSGEIETFLQEARLLSERRLEDGERDYLELLRAEALSERGAYLEASSSGELLVRKHPRSARVRTLLGHAYLHRGLPKEAERELSMALNLDQSSEPALVGLGILAEREGLLDYAEDTFLRAVELNPFGRLALHHLIRLRLRLGQVRNSTMLLRRSLEVEPLDIELRYYLASILTVIGERTEARVEVEKILFLDAAHEGCRKLLSTLDGSRSYGN